MKLKIKSVLSYILCLAFMLPISAKALTVADILGATQQAYNQSGEAKAYIVVDKSSNQILLSKNADLKWPPASLTKLVTALVFLDSKTPLDKTVAMKKEDEVGGQRLPTKAGISYKTRDLLHAALIASDNNAAHALARSTGLSEQDFVSAMNDKAKALGANNTKFYESTGMNPQNYTTALDFAKIVQEAFNQPYLSLIAKKTSYVFSATNSKKYRHVVQSTDELLNDSSISIVGGKTGFLEEAQYNFASVTQDGLGNQYVIVVLGAPSPSQRFEQAKQLAFSAMAIKEFGQGTAVLGASTTASSTLSNP